MNTLGMDPSPSSFDSTSLLFSVLPDWTGFLVQVCEGE